ncbi:MAG: dienelactone hydrolase [Bacteroidota bacterium]
MTRPAYFFLSITFSFLICQNVHSQHEFLIGDALPDAPELAHRGTYGVGVKTIELVHKNQLNVLSIKDGKGEQYDRPITIEVWYPANIPENVEQLETYTQVLGKNATEGRPVVPFTFQGRAVRDAVIVNDKGKFPLVILSHGYVGSRFLFTYLSENLASKGYVVVSIDHTDSTYRDAANFTSTLVNRPLDQLFVLNEIERLSANASDSFLANLVDTSNTGLVGYSMGGYGGLNTCGAGYSKAAITFFKSMTGGSDALDKLAMENESYTASIDTRIKAFVALAPWGMTNGVWDETGLAGLKIPTFFVAGSEDDISGYEKGIKAIYEGAVNSDRYLLTYMNARHNVAPNPPAPATMKEGLPIDEYLRYADSVWDMRRINNVNQHFITAFLGTYLKGSDYKDYLNLKPDSNTGNWKGFKPRTSVGMELLHASAGNE